MQRERKRKGKKGKGKKNNFPLFFGMDTDIKYINLLH